MEIEYCLLQILKPLAFMVRSGDIFDRVAKVKSEIPILNNVDDLKFSEVIVRRMVDVISVYIIVIYIIRNQKTLLTQSPQCRLFASVTPPNAAQG